MSQQTVKLPNGNQMPLVGLGTWLATNEQEIETAVDEALAAGYRHFDTAYMYTNEKTIGRVLKRWIDSGKLRREELFIVTKLPMIGNSAEKVGHFVKLQLEALQLDYLDLYLIHAPVGFKYVSDTDLFPMSPDKKVLLDTSTNLEEIWKALEVQVASGRIRSIGVSNFNCKQIERIVKIAKTPLSNLQVELHVYFQQKDLRETCAKHGITICAYAPIGSPGRGAVYAARGIKFEVKSPMDEPIVQEIAKKHNKTPAQILLRFLVQHRIVVIPKSTNPQRLRQNIEIFDFELSPVDMRRLEALDKGDHGRTFGFEAFPGSEKHPECPYSNLPSATK